MATHRAVNQCFHNGHLFEVGDEATFREGEKVPRHFEPIEESAEESEGDGSTDGDAAAPKKRRGRKPAAT